MAIDQEDKDFSNLIGGNQKFLYCTFTVEVNSQKTMASKTPIW